MFIFLHSGHQTWERPPTACSIHEATCMNGDCIPKSALCNGKPGIHPFDSIL